MFYFHLVVFDSAETCLNQDDPLQAWSVATRRRRFSTASRTWSNSCVFTITELEKEEPTLTSPHWTRWSGLDTRKGLRHCGPVIEPWPFTRSGRTTCLSPTPGVTITAVTDGPPGSTLILRPCWGFSSAAPWPVSACPGFSFPGFSGTMRVQFRLAPVPTRSSPDSLQIWSRWKSRSALWADLNLWKEMCCLYRGGSHGCLHWGLSYPWWTGVCSPPLPLPPSLV